MTTLSVGSGQLYSTIAAAVNAAQSGDTIDVQTGTYTNDFVNAYKSLSFTALGGLVTMVATVSPPNGKAIVDEGGAGINVSFDGFAFTGAKVADMNGAGIRYEGGSLTVTNSHFYGNQEGILGAPDPNGTVSISTSEFDHNGAGDGYSHNMYIGDIKQFTLTNSYVHDADLGHEVKSRAESNVITDNRILDNSSTSSYEIDLPNGGNATISGNVIEQGPNSANSNIIAYGEEGGLHAGTALSVIGNTIVNDENRGPALWNASGSAATFHNNAVYGFGATALVNGPAVQSGTTVLASRPMLDQSAPDTVPGSTPMPPTPPTVSPPAAPPTADSGLVVNVAEDAWQGNAQFTLQVDGKQVGGTYTASALHGAGQSQAISVATTLGAGGHTLGISFINDAYGGTASTDRNLYVTSASYGGQAIADSTFAEMSTGTHNLAFTVGPVVTSTATLMVSEDAWQGDAQFTVAVDGKQTGGVYTATAAHSAGQSQAITIAGIAEGFTPHDIAVTFLNDAYGGSPATDRNLYVNAIQFDGKTAAGASAALYRAGTQHVTVSAPAGWTG